eukprot:3299337-Prymnesium_polylepis.1
MRDANNASSPTLARRRRVLNRLADRFAYSTDLSAVLYVAMGSRTNTERSDLLQSTWCRPPAHCVFVTEAEEDDSRLTIHDHRQLPVRVSSLPAPSPSPEGCCANATDERSRAFFCSPHRKRTLRAQYRFLPALQWAKQQLPPSAALTKGDGPRWSQSRDGRGSRTDASPHTPRDGKACPEQTPTSPGYRWVALVDDDSFVF